jgi:type VII secretion-associated serine protease mycosin
VAVVGLPASPVSADSIRDDQWHLRYLKVAEAHKHSQGAGVIVGVVDSGVHPHPDLRNNLLSGADVVPGGTGDGKADNNGHGTSMAGLIAGHGRSGGKGVLGIAPKARILPLRASTDSDKFFDTDDDIAEGIQQAITRGARVINVSIAGGPSPSLKIAVEAAQRSDIVVVAGAGNVPGSFGVVYPAAFKGVVAVGAIDRSGNHADISVRGPELVLTAPGVAITSTNRDGKYRLARGTSDSTALVSGAALVRSKFPNLSAPEVIHRLTATATDKGPPGRDNEYGYGVLNLVGALTADVPPLAGGASASAPPASPAQATNGAGAPTQAAGPGSGGSGGSATVFALIGAVIVGGALGLIGVVTARRRGRTGVAS